MAEHGKDASQRAELRERILVTATEAFASKGIKSITMDDIAAALGISKRTLYEVFSDKESLLKECILKAQSDREAYLQEVYEQSHNVLEVILAVFQKSIEVFHQTNVSIRPRACFSPSYNKVKSQTKHVWLLTLL